MAEPISVVTEQLPKSQVGMTIEVPTEVVDAAYERVLNRLVSRAKIEGFRPGRAPRSLVEARLGPAAVREEVVEAMIPDVIRQALQEKSWSAAGPRSSRRPSASCRRSRSPTSRR